MLQDNMQLTNAFKPTCCHCTFSAAAALSPKACCGAGNLPPGQLARPAGWSPARAGAESLRCLFAYWNECTNHWKARLPAKHTGMYALQSAKMKVKQPALVHYTPWSSLLHGPGVLHTLVACSMAADSLCATASSACASLRFIVRRGAGRRTDCCCCSSSCSSSSSRCGSRCSGGEWRRCPPSAAAERPGPPRGRVARFSCCSGGGDGVDRTAGSGSGGNVRRGSPLPTAGGARLRLRLAAGAAGSWVPGDCDACAAAECTALALACSWLACGRNPKLGRLPPPMPEGSSDSGGSCGPPFVASCISVPPAPRLTSCRGAECDGLSPLEPLCCMVAGAGLWRGHALGEAEPLRAAGESMRCGDGHGTSSIAAAALCCSPAGGVNRLRLTGLHSLLQELRVLSTRGP